MKTPTKRRRARAKARKRDGLEIAVTKIIAFLDAWHDAVWPGDGQWSFNMGERYDELKKAQEAQQCQKK